MKRLLKISICFMLLQFLTSVAHAQIGIKGGFGVSDIVFADEGQTLYLGYEIDYMEHKNPLLSFQFGTFYSIPFNKKVYFQPELLFVRQGLDYDIAFLYDNITYQIRINYLQVPLLFYYRTVPEKKSHPGLFFGPYAALKLNAVREVEIEDDREESYVSNIRSADLGIIGGFSMDFDLPSGQLSCELRTSYGLVDMMDLPETYVPFYYGPDNERARNVSVTLIVGYRFSKTISKEEL